MSVLSARTQQPAGGWAKIYFAAFTTFTLGVGDYVPNGPVWQMLTSVAVISGLGLTTMAITYLVPVVTAVTARRTLASRIDGLGRTPQDMLVAGWHRGSFHYFETVLPQLAQQITLTAERQLSYHYPILRYFHSTDRRKDSHVHIWTLDEAVTLLHDAVPAAQQPHPGTLPQVRHATEQLVRHVPIAEAPTEPPAADLNPLRAAGIPTVDDVTFATRIQGLADHRAKMRAYAQQSLWYALGDRVA